MAERGYALLGYAAAGATAGVLLATRVREKAVLPGGHTVYAVTDSAWAMVPLQVRAGAAICMQVWPCTCSSAGQLCVCSLKAWPLLLHVAASARQPAHPP